MQRLLAPSTRLPKSLLAQRSGPSIGPQPTASARARVSGSHGTRPRDCATCCGPMRALHDEKMRSILADPNTAVKLHRSTHRRPTSTVTQTHTRCECGSAGQGCHGLSVSLCVSHHPQGHHNHLALLLFVPPLFLHIVNLAISRLPVAFSSWIFSAKIPKDPVCLPVALHRAGERRALMHPQRLKSGRTA